MRRPGAALARLFEGLPETFVWLFAGGFVSALASFVFPFLSLALTARGASPRGAGLAMSALGAGILCSGPLSGELADRLGRRRTLVLALLVAAASAAALGLAASPRLTFLAAFLFGVSSSGAASPIQALVADLVEPPLRARAYGLLYWASNLGTGVSLVLGGLLAERSFALPFFADAATTILFALVVLARVRETSPGARTPPSRVAARAGYRPVLADRAFLAFLAAIFPFALVFFQVGATLPIDMARHGLSPATYGVVLSVNTALIVVLQPFAPRLLGRLSYPHALALSSALVGLGFGAYALCGSPLGFALATAVWSLGEIGYAPSASAYTALLAPPELRGRYAGAFALAVGFAGALAPLLGTSVFEALGDRALFGLCLGLGALSSSSFLALGRFRRAGPLPAP
ncbi:MAG TPA: MFS transporter [Anaeromyxobacteraceae bacterium]|nr:MFS transporter [Anaeromyxobacteraceae bacterium]